MPLVGEVIRASVKEAARLLDTSEHAVRQRLYRGSLESEKDERGNVVVLIPESLKVRGCEKGSNGNGCGYYSNSEVPTIASRSTPRARASF